MKCTYPGCLFDSDDRERSLIHFIDHVVAAITVVQKDWTRLRKRQAAKCLHELANRVESTNNKKVGIMQKLQMDQAKSICTCGHVGDGKHSEHADTTVSGHGACNKCVCHKFTWLKFMTSDQQLEYLRDSMKGHT